MDNITDYMIIEDNNINRLVATVKTQINYGWQPLGGMTAYYDGVNEDCYYTQTMVKY